ncbi:1-phosphofructokinase [Caldicellulosiruptor morganii]|uniref:Tagatose-6-phosphate kinase n=1 Tax=Caldicellulosiruptor morganii TaxID=1387555 RepID=A0ABY7BT23_9FIRM|nr:1-phosphofructokinase [Caldicellulosiruptor morganii]WAM35031.1 1-phosphofructokinase [Caldicellulosiruptor morganii]
MIYTLTLNPAIDMTVYINKLEKGQVNRSSFYMLDAGGKGINVSKVVKALGGETVALGFLGKENSDYILKYLKRFGIKNDFVFVDGFTRINVKIVETEASAYTDINQAGFEITEKDIQNLFDKLEEVPGKDDIFVISGSLPGNCDEEIYFEIIKKLKQKDVVVIFDADGNALKKGLEAAPDVIKPNIYEFKSLFDVDERDLNSLVLCARQLIFEKGVKMVLVSMGENGAVYVSKNTALFAKPVKTEVKSTTGAGDSMVAAIAFGIEKKMSEEEMFKFACACALAKVAQEGVRAPDKNSVQQCFEKIELERLG